MSEADVGDRDQMRSTEEEDRAFESAILQQVLALHPAPIALEDLAREMGSGAAFAERDALERAVRDLCGSGLLHRSDSLLTPTRAALRFDELLGD